MLFAMIRIWQLRRTAMDEDRLVIEVRDAFDMIPAPSFDQMVTSRRRRSSHSARVPVVVLAVALAILVVGLAWLRPGGGAAPAAAWSAVPFPQDSTIIARAQTACGDGVVSGKTFGPVPVNQGMPMSVVDARANTAVAFFTNGSTYTACEFSWNGDGAIGSATTWGGALASTDARSVDILTAQMGGDGGSKARMIVGHVGAGTSKVLIHLASGTEVTASVGGGYYLAWWPQFESVTAINALDGSGKTQQTLSNPTLP
jgi:hypothetical protein